MRQLSHNYTKLPRQLLEEVGGFPSLANGGNRKKRGGATDRKERRRLAREQKKSSHAPRNRARPLKRKESRDAIDEQTKYSKNLQHSRARPTTVEPNLPKSILKVPRSTLLLEDTSKDHSSSSPSPPPSRISRATQDRLAADDAEIAALEKVLGVKGKKKLPKSFEDDGLNSLLEDIDDTVAVDQERLGERKRNEEKDQWLESKRQKALTERSRNQDLNISEDLDQSASGSESGSLEFSESESEANDGHDTDGPDGSDLADEDSNQYIAERPPRENPYIAPQTGQPIKYVPPSLRVKEMSNSEDLSRLRRQMQGLLNRLSEANILSILGDVERIYRDHPRHHVSTTLLDLLLGLLSDPTVLTDTFIILHAGFIAAVYKVVGPDFGAQAIDRINEFFEQDYDAMSSQENVGKKLTNLVSLLSELYNFQVVGSRLIYDFVRLFLEELSETNTELLLKIIRNAGSQLRQDDPSSLKDIVVQLQSSVAKVGEDNLSVRTKFMIETINNLKNNRMKTGLATTTMISEHTTRMKKTLGSLNTRSLKASEPIRISLKDLRDRGKVGTWWLVGASYKGGVQETDDLGETSSHIDQRNGNEEEIVGHLSNDLVQLAKEQRMNTDVRRSIFVAIMSSSDYNDAYLRLMKLRLKRSQRLEIPKVLIHCAAAEKMYNPFYTYLSRRICSDKNLKISFQFSLWDIFKQMGEGDDGSDEDQDNGGAEKLGLRSIVNLAKMFGVLVAEGGLGLGILKNLNLTYLQPKTRTFVEILMISAILRSQQDSGNNRDEKSLLALFLKPKEMPNMAGGLQYFLKKVVRKTDVARSKLEKETLKWACKTTCDALAILAANVVVDE